jgi:hypothetical protein
MVERPIYMRGYLLRMQMDPDIPSPLSPEPVAMFWFTALRPTPMQSSAMMRLEFGGSRRDTISPEPIANIARLV